MSLEETLGKLERRIEEAASRLKGLSDERRVLTSRLEELEGAVSTHKAEAEKTKGEQADLESVESEKRELTGQIESLKQEKAKADEELSRLKGERQTVSKRVEALLKRLDKLDLD